MVALAEGTASVVSDDANVTVKFDAGATLAVTVPFRVPPSIPLAGIDRLSEPVLVTSKVLDSPITAGLPVCSALATKDVPIACAVRFPDQIPPLKDTCEGEVVTDVRRVKRMLVSEVPTLGVGEVPTHKSGLPEEFAVVPARRIRDPLFEVAQAALLVVVVELSKLTSTIRF
jgi:hypothetical protein